MNPEAKFETITPEKAKQYLLNNDHNRPLNSANLELIVREIKRDNFFLTGESIKISKTDRLLDGQHRLMAIVKSGVSVKMLVIKGLEDDAFKYIDTGKTRSAADVLGIEGVKNPQKIASIVKFIINFKNGYYHQASNSYSKGKTKITNAIVSEYFEKRKDKINSSVEYGYNSHNNLVSKTALAGLHYIFKEKSSDDANEFCNRVCDGTSLTKEDPIYLLRERFTNDLRNKRKMSMFEKIALICKAWNLFRQNKKISRLTWEQKEGFPQII